MEITIIHYIAGCTGAYGLFWLIDRILERNFCKKAGKEANDNYIELQKAKKKK